jgi:hypothetical protein
MDYEIIGIVFFSIILIIIIINLIKEFLLTPKVVHRPVMLNSRRYQNIKKHLYKIIRKPKTKVVFRHTRRLYIPFIPKPIATNDRIDRLTEQLYDTNYNFNLNDEDFEALLLIVQNDTKPKIDKSKVATSDKQNVHDSGVIKTITQSIENVKNKIGDFIENPEITAKITNYFPTVSDKNNKIKQTLTHINENDGLVMPYGMTHKNILNVVDNYINKQDKEKKDNLIGILGDQLSNCINKKGMNVCNTGIFNRIINTLNGVTDEVSIKPEWALRKEMLNKVPIIKTEFNKNFSKDHNLELENVEDNDTYDDEFIKYMKKSLISEYSPVMPSKKINEEITSWGY